MVTQQSSSTRQSGATAKTDPPCPDGGSTATPVVDTPSASGNGTPSSANSGSYSGSSPSSTPIVAADIITTSVCGHQGARAAPKKVGLSISNSVRTVGDGARSRSAIVCTEPRVLAR